MLYRFLDSWKAGDYPSSFDNLHRYFDYTMQSRDRTFYQYALLNLAILQADFGCFTEAIAAMQETISTARENKDMACLNYSLSWLYHFGKAHPEEIGEIQKSGVLGTEKEALAFLKTKARDANMWSLLSTCLLSEARLSLTNVSFPETSLPEISDSLSVILNIGYRERVFPWPLKTSQKLLISMLPKTSSMPLVVKCRCKDPYLVGWVGFDGINSISRKC